jgi:hypothetical protein
MHTAWLFELAGGAISDYEDTCIPKIQREARFTVAALHQWEIGIVDDRCRSTAEDWISGTLMPVNTGGPYPTVRSISFFYLISLLNHCNSFLAVTNRLLARWRALVPTGHVSLRSNISMTLLGCFAIRSGHWMPMGKPSSPSGTSPPVRDSHATIYFVELLSNGFQRLCIRCRMCGLTCSVCQWNELHVHGKHTTSKVQPILLKKKRGMNLIERYHILVLVQRYQKTRQ